MSTYGVMQNRIADELARTDLSDQTKLAIQSAIDYYKDDRFWFNEGESTLATASGVANKIMPTTFGELDVVTVTISGGERYEMRLESYDWIRENVTLSTLVGRPEHYAIFEQYIWYYPVPDAIYTITLSGLIYFTMLSGVNDTNAWMVEAEQLIRHRAKADLFANVIRNDKEMMKMIAVEEQVLYKLRQKTVQRMSSGRLKPTKF